MRLSPAFFDWCTQLPWVETDIPVFFGLRVEGFTVHLNDLNVLEGSMEHEISHLILAPDTHIWDPYWGMPQRPPFGPIINLGKDWVEFESAVVAIQRMLHDNLHSFFPDNANSIAVNGKAYLKLKGLDLWEAVEAEFHRKVSLVNSTMPEHRRSNLQRFDFTPWRAKG